MVDISSLTDCGHGAWASWSCRDPQERKCYILPALGIEHGHIGALPNEFPKLGHINIGLRAGVVEPRKAIALHEVPFRGVVRHAPMMPHFRLKVIYSALASVSRFRCRERGSGESPLWVPIAAAPDRRTGLSRDTPG
jgi:hypothetical protein